MDLFSASVDESLNIVKNTLLQIPNFEEKVGKAIRQAIDEVVDGRYTSRFSIEQIDKTEKTYIGTKVQHILQHDLHLAYGEKLDMKVADIEVDIKFTIKSNWTIPLEAVDELCLLVSANDNDSTFSVGLLRTSQEVLNRGKNRDSKTTISASGKRHIDWLIPTGQLPPNILLSLPKEIISEIYAFTAGQPRIDALFRLCPGIVFNSAAIESVAAQKDSSKRVRDARLSLESMGIRIYSVYDNKELALQGFPALKKGEFVSLRV